MGLAKAGIKALPYHSNLSVILRNRYDKKPDMLLRITGANDLFILYPKENSRSNALRPATWLRCRQTDQIQSFRLITKPKGDCFHTKRLPSAAFSFVANYGVSINYIGLGDANEEGFNLLGYD